MWYSEQDKLTPEQRFIFQVQMLAERYGVDVEIDTKNRVVNFLTNDFEKQIALAAELDDLFGNYAF